MSKMKNIQVEIAAWTQRNFPENNLVLDSLGLAEEAGEVCRAVLKDQQKIRGTHDEWMVELASELGDVMIKCFQLAELADMQLQTCLEGRWHTIQNRDWTVNKLGHGLPDDGAAPVPAGVGG